MKTVVPEDARALIQALGGTKTVHQKLAEMGLTRDWRTVGGWARTGIPAAYYLWFVYYAQAKRPDVYINPKCFIFADVTWNIPPGFAAPDQEPAAA